MAEFFAELKRRHIYRVGAAYVVVAWALTQGVAVLAQVFALPSWIAQTAIVLLALGFPVVLLFAWTIERKPHEAVTSAMLSKPTVLDGALFGALIIVGLLIGYQQIAQTRQAGVDSARSASLDPGGTISLAVLPFSNLSSDPEQEFFSDGITEEITSALAKVPDLRVVGRTSAFQFKGQNQDLRAIGQNLGATHLIEGSVRKAGDRVRITVQLIKSDDGTHVWSQNYDRQLTDIFAIQEDIARTVTASFNMSLGLRPGENLVNNRSIDTDSYEKFLRARSTLTLRGGVSDVQEIRTLTEAISLLEEIIAKNPAYAPAWTVLAGAYGVLANRHGTNPNPAEARTLTAELRAKGEAALQRALQLDPGSVDAQAQLGWFMRTRANLIKADELLKKSATLDPVNANGLFNAGMVSGATGRLTDALEFNERGHAVDPLYPNLAAATVRLRWLNGRNDEAIALAKTLRAGNRAPLLALIYASMGRYSEAADALMETGSSDPTSEEAQAARLLRMLPVKPAREDLPSLPGLNMLYLYLGAPERALQAYERAADIGHINGDRALVWHPAYAEVRKTERFKALMHKAGLVEYWRAKGWPEFCRPVGADDFECG